jgi:hypothetical protein
LTIGSVPKTVLGAILAATLVCLLALAWMTFAPRRVPEGQPPLARLGSGSLPAFRDAFNSGAGEVRVLVLLSPT